jgi:hypothetical protein
MAEKMGDEDDRESGSLRAARRTRQMRPGAATASLSAGTGSPRGYLRLVKPGKTSNGQQDLAENRATDSDSDDRAWLRASRGIALAMLLALPFWLLVAYLLLR